MWSSERPDFVGEIDSGGVCIRVQLLKTGSNSNAIGGGCVGGGPMDSSSLSSLASASGSIVLVKLVT